MRILLSDTWTVTAMIKDDFVKRIGSSFYKIDDLNTNTKKI